MGNVSVTNTKSGDYHFFFSISSITGWPFTYGILNMVEFVLCLISPRFLPFLNYKFVISGFRSVYGIFVLDIRVWSAFFAALSALSFPCMPMWLGIYSPS